MSTSFNPNSNWTSNLNIIAEAIEAAAEQMQTQMQSASNYAVQGSLSSDAEISYSDSQTKIANSYQGQMQKLASGTFYTKGGYVGTNNGKGTPYTSGKGVTTHQGGCTINGKYYTATSQQAQDEENNVNSQFQQLNQQTNMGTQQFQLVSQESTQGIQNLFSELRQTSQDGEQAIQFTSFLVQLLQQA
ncbi:MAG: hypothetical protein KF898_03120 [Parachlamydiales bacterium]|nr:hypothetical protein [Verrucomicrobiota bacterium]MBX3718624.1 hypothetical protein [Candidatus Acheromyda pituitae]